MYINRVLCYRKSHTSFPSKRMVALCTLMDFVFCLVNTEGNEAAAPSSQSGSIYSQTSEESSWTVYSLYNSVCNMAAHRAADHSWMILIFKIFKIVKVSLSILYRQLILSHRDLNCLNILNRLLLHLLHLDLARLLLLDLRICGLCLHFIQL